MKPICVPCQRFFTPTQNGIYLLEQLPEPSNAKPGTAEPEKWKPYKIWHGDLFKCDGCGATIISGVALHPLVECFESDFDDQVELAKATAGFCTVNDC